MRSSGYGRDLLLCIDPFCEYLIVSGRRLRIDPDILLLSGDLTPGEIQAQPEWQVLRAVNNENLYSLPPGVADHPWNIVDLPFYSRWLAELAYPDRLRPRLRLLMRKTYREELGYEASEKDLDHALGIKENSRSRGYGRFMVATNLSQ